MQSPPQRFAWKGSGLALGVVLLLALLAAINWALHPDQAGRWLRAMLTLPLLLTGITLWYRWNLRSMARRGDQDASRVRDYFGSAIALACLAIGIQQGVHHSLEIWVAFTGREDLELERRILGLASGATMIVVGNALPKILTPLSMLGPDAAARVSTARRFVGLVFVMLGSATALAFLFAPVALAIVLAKGAGAGCVLTVFAAIVWMNAGPAHSEGGQ